MSRISTGLATILLVVPALTAACVAQTTQGNYPSRSIKIVLGFPSGVLTDIVARTFADKLSSRFGQSVVVENRPGAGGTLGAKTVAAAEPDGYSLLFVNSQHAIAPAVYKNLGYDTLTSFAGIALVAESPSAVIVSPKMGVKSLKEFIAAAKAKPESIVYATAGVGSQTHLAGAYFSSRAAIKLIALPYRDTGAIIADMLSGRTHATFAPPGFLLGQIQAGELLALAVTTAKGMDQPIKAPSVAETAIPGYEYSTWFGFLAPAKTPVAILDLLANEFRTVSEDQGVKEKFLKSAVVTRTLPLKEFDGYIKSEVAKQGQIVKSAGIGAQ